MEYSSTGSIYSYNKIIDCLLKENIEVKYKIIKMETKQLSDEIILLLYTIQIGENITNRSSIWKKESNGWKILFHQGTESKEII